jgi:predicted Zn-dependent peptidase
MSRIAKNDIYYGRDVPIAEVAARFDAVTNDDVVRVASRLFGQGVVQLTVLGNVAAQQLDDGILEG